MELDEITLRKTVGKNIALYRKSHRDTQAALGQKLNYTDKAVSKWERGESLPDIYVLSRIAALYGVSVGVLIGESKPELQDSPHLHLYVWLLSMALAFLIGTVLIVAFEIADVAFNGWLFLLYAAALSALLSVIFTMLWWGLWRQLAAWSSFIWLIGLTVLLTVPGVAAAKGLMICVAVQLIVLVWIFYRYSRIPKAENPPDQH